jgi:CHAT domain-containing protein
LPYQRNPSSATKEATLIGNPDFSQFPKPYAPLPGSEQEIKRISQKLSSSGWKTTILIGAEATEKRVKSIRSPEILHIATHGFFDHKKNYTSLVEDMLQSGLVFSKSNTEQDGILTAFEASALSLENTSLVVLSACETGLGEYHPGEDIYGLQRGFLSAGAKNLMMSLWKVDDQATSDLMDIFYTRYLSQNHPSKALREAQLRMIKKYPEPYYWGPFLSIQD